MTVQFFVTLIIAIAATAVGLQATEEVISLMFVCMAAISWLLTIIIYCRLVSTGTKSTFNLGLTCSDKEFC